MADNSGDWQGTVYCNARRYNTASLTQLIDEQDNQRHSNGITLLGAWQTKTGRVLVVTYSLWASSRNDGTNVGVQAHFADADEIFDLAKRYGGAIANLVPMGDDEA